MREVNFLAYFQFLNQLKKEERVIVIGLIIFLLSFNFPLLMGIGFILMVSGGVIVIKKIGFKHFFSTPLSKPLLLFLLIALVSMFKIVSLRSAFNMLGTILEVYLGFFLAYYIFKNKSIEFNQKILSFFFLGGVIVSLSGIYARVFLNLERTGSLTSNANLYGIYMLFLVILAFALFFQKEYKYKKWACFLVPLFSYNLIYSLSRSAFLGTIIALLFFLLFKNKKVLLLFLLILSISPFILPAPLLGRIEGTYQSFINREDQRIYIWKNAYEQFKERKIFGVGIGQYREHYQIYENAPSQRTFNHAHNLILQIMAELGLVGLLTFLYMLFLIIKLTYRKLPFNNDFKGVLELSLASLFVGFFVQAQFEFSLIGSAISFLIGIFLAWYLALLLE